MYYFIKEKFFSHLSVVIYTVNSFSNFLEILLSALASVRNKKGYSFRVNSHVYSDAQIQTIT